MGRLVGGGFARPGALDALAWATGVAEAFDLLAAGLAGDRPGLTPTVEDVLESEP